MTFLDQAGVREKISDLVSKSKKVRAAVAFWGKGACDSLGFCQKGGAAEVICNLRMGGTNPDEIRKLIKAGVRVSQCDTLHAKVYLFDDCAILGSSNASANGLGLEGSEQSGWIEANVLIRQPYFQTKISKWLDQVLTREISEDDLKKAEEAWTRRKRVNPIVAGTLSEAFEHDPQSIESVYCIAYSDYDLGPGAEKRREELLEAGVITNARWYQPIAALKPRTWLIRCDFTNRDKPEIAQRYAYVPDELLRSEILDEPDLFAAFPKQAIQIGSKSFRLTKAEQRRVLSAMNKDRKIKRALDSGDDIALPLSEFLGEHR